MPIILEPRQQGKTIIATVNGKLMQGDYEIFKPEIEKQISKHGKIRILLKTKDFQGWDAGALWEDFKFDLNHFNDIEKLAIVGDKKWEQGMAVFCKPFTTAKVKFFEHDDYDEAVSWIETPVGQEKEKAWSS